MTTPTETKAVITCDAQGAVQDFTFTAHDDEQIDASIRTIDQEKFPEARMFARAIYAAIRKSRP